MSENFSLMRFFGDHMILQSDRENCARGKAPDGSFVVLSITDSRGDQRNICSPAAENGVFELIIPPYEPSYESYVLTFSCDGEEITFTDVLFGELYHISGQSNMELQICRTIDPLDPIIPKGSGFIREFRVPVQCCFGKDEE